MSYDRPPQTPSELLEELRDIAQLGLNYTQDPFDRARYQRLLTRAAEQYGLLASLPPEEITDRFRAELGHITPKVGVDAAIFDADGRLLLTRRADDRLWCLPCGWAELAESPQESLRREVLEETGLEVAVGALLDVRHRLPGQFGPHTSYHILYHCVPTGGALSTSEESLAVAYRDPVEIAEWHADHAEAARIARDYWSRVLSGEASPA
jgi:8-oxo-dGTP pyrophosphatase MutT (NUDIX family)